MEIFEIETKLPNRDKENGINAMDYVIAEATNIYMDVSEDKEFSKYYLEELIKKNNLLRRKLDESLDYYKSGIKEQINRYKLFVFEKIARVLSTLGLSMYFVLTVPILSAIGTFVSILYIVLKYKDLKKVKLNEEKSMMELETFKAKMKRIGINIDNNEALLREKITKSNSEINNKKDKEDRVDIANKIIQRYFETGELSNDVNDDTANLIVSMLKSDLESDSNDLHELLDKAREKVHLEEEMVLTLN